MKWENTAEFSESGIPRDHPRVPTHDHFAESLAEVRKKTKGITKIIEKVKPNKLKRKID